MTERHPHRGQPALRYMLTEWRALFELAALPWALPGLAATPRGDGHSILLLPGFMANDASLLPLKLFLVNRGYEVQTWGLGQNVGLQDRHLKAMEQKVRFLHHRSGRKVSLVGWSLGGVFALYAGHQASECVRSVITLGSPVSMDPHKTQLAKVVQLLYRRIAHPLGTHAHTLRPRLQRLRQAVLPLPVSCIYSATDGVVPPQEATTEGDGALQENIRVPGSHTGLGFNAIVLAIVAERLAQPEDDWQRFSPQGWWGRACRRWVAS